MKAVVRDCFFRFLLGLVLATIVSLQTAAARPRPPLPPLPEIGRLSHQRFDEPWRAPTHQGIDSTTWLESWSGYALNRQGLSVWPWVVPMLDATGRPNVGAQQGTIRFWFRPDWSSAQLGGEGPGHWARLVESGTISGNGAAVWWSLYVSPDGSTVYWSGQGAGGPVDILSAEVAWPAGEWRLLALTYTPTNTALFLDAELAATGGGLPALPTNAVPLTALVIGSKLDGTQTAEGQFEEFGTSARLAPAASLLAYWTVRSPLAALGPISVEEDEARQQLVAAARVADRAAGLRGPGPLHLDLSLCGQGDPVYPTNFTSTPVTNFGPTVTFDVAGGWSGTNYFLYRADATNLVSAFTNSAWQWLQIVHACDAVTLTDQPANGAFYLIGFDTNKDSDGDGMPDAWEVANGLDPLMNDAGADPDDDGTNNLAEYTSGSNPFDNMLIAWGDDASGQSTVPWGFGAVAAMAGGGGGGAGGHTLVLTPQGTVVAWGANNYGQTNVPSGLSNVVAVAAGGDQSVALKTDGTVVQWGRWYADVPAGLTNAKAIAAGYQHVLALRADGTVVAWGRSNCPANFVPSGLIGVKAISAG